MSTGSRVLAVLTTVLTTVLLPGLLLGPSAAASSATAPAAPSGRIDSLTTAEGSAQLVFSSAGLPAGVGLDPASIAVQFRRTGQEPVPLEAGAAPLEGSGQTVQQTAVLTVDTSGSLGDDGMEAVRAAALGFLDTVPASVAVGLVTFGDPAVPRIAPTTDRGPVRDAVEGLQSDGGTALYDATIEATRMFPGQGVQRILLLTDGADDNAAGTAAGSDASLEEAVAAVQTTGVGLTAVAFTSGASRDALGALAQAGSGQVVDAGEADALAGAFQAEATSIAASLIVSVAVPPELAGARGDVVVTVGAGGETLTDSAFTTLPAAAQPSAAPSAEPSETAQAAPPPVDVPGAEAGPPGTPVLWAALAGVFLAVMTVGVVLARAGRRDPDQVRRARSLAVYTMHARGPAPRAAQPAAGGPTRLGDNVLTRSAVELAGRAVERGDATDRLARSLDAASVPLRPGEWVVLQVAIAGGAGLLFLLLSRGNPVALLLGLLLGAVGPRVYLGVRRSRRRSAFLRVMPDTLGLLASGLRAGYSLPQAMDSVAREGQEPLRSEFNRALVEARLGLPPEDAMEGIAERMGSRDFRWVVMAIRIQREVGGNLAELLDTVAGTLRERARLKRQVEVLSAEGRLSAWIVGLLPVAFCTYLVFLQPDYLRPLYTDPLGIALLLLGGVLFGVGVLGLRWAVTVDV